MNYISTRARAPACEFDEALLSGLATDGGLYVPEVWPQIGLSELGGLRDMSYPVLAAHLMRHFMGEGPTASSLMTVAAEAYGTFDHKAVAPLVQIGPNEWILELFHGPTLAFKDFALQLLGRLFDQVLARQCRRMTVIGATSGDTGSAAIAACQGRENIDIVILHPQGRISEVQRRQMTTVAAENVINIAVDGTFDDCQDMVKAMFADPEFRTEVGMGAVNSINWARIMGQVVYYVWAGLHLGAPDRPVAFSVPTGNFGNVFAAYVARQMALPVSALIVGSNANDVLTRFFETGAMQKQPVVETLSPAMDIQISSNFERLLFELYGRDGQAIERLFAGFRDNGVFAVDDRIHAEANRLFSGVRATDAETAAMIRTVHAETGMLICPHTAVGVHAARSVQRDPSIPVVCLATAHPAKFPDAVQTATGIAPPLPPRMADLFDRPERCAVLGNDLETVKRFVRERVRATA